jgi:hypothetical protein
MSGSPEGAVCLGGISVGLDVENEAVGLREEKNL